MNTRIGLGLSLAIACTVNAGAQNAAPPTFPSEQPSAAARERNWRPPRFSWGHPNL